MRLLDLQPEWLRTGPEGHRRGVPRAEANGVWFLCPKCFEANGGPVGTHAVTCHEPSVSPEDEMVGPGRWTMTGGGFDDLTLSAQQSSVHLLSGCGAHFFVEAGNVRMC